MEVVNTESDHNETREPYGNLKDTISPSRLHKLLDDGVHKQFNDYTPSAGEAVGDLLDGLNTGSLSHPTQDGVSVNDTAPRTVNNVDILGSPVHYEKSTSSSPLSSIAASFASYDEESETHSAPKLSNRSKSLSEEPPAEDDQASRMASSLLGSPDDLTSSVLEDDVISVRREESHLEQRTNVQSSDFRSPNAESPEACTTSARETVSANNEPVELQEIDGGLQERRKQQHTQTQSVRSTPEEPSDKSIVPECAGKRCSVPATSTNSGTTLESGPQQYGGPPLQQPNSYEEIKQEIIQSYLDCGLEPNVVFTPVKVPHDPTSITMTGGWRKARLVPQTMEKLRTRKWNILKTWVASGDGSTVGEKRDIDLIRQLCTSPMIDAKVTDVLSAMNKFCRQSNTTDDQMKLLDFWKLSVLAVAWQGDNHDEVDIPSDRSRDPLC